MMKQCKTIITVKFCSYSFVCHSEGKYTIYMLSGFFLFQKVNAFCWTYVNDYISTKTVYGRKESPRNCGGVGKSCHESDENI